MKQSQAQFAAVVAVVLSLLAVALIFKGDAENAAAKQPEPASVYTFVSPSFSGQSEQAKEDAEWKKRVDDMNRAASTQIADRQAD